MGGRARGGKGSITPPKCSCESSCIRRRDRKSRLARYAGSLCRLLCRLLCHRLLVVVRLLIDADVAAVPQQFPTVYCCEADPSRSDDLFAAKVYHEREKRNFKNDSMYREGRIILDRRMRKAFEKKSRAGRAFQAGSWQHFEYDALELLHGAGADVPIDFPQTIDPRFNPNARDLLFRDLDNVCRYFTRFGVQADPRRITDRLWGRFKRSEL
jgi:RIO1 family